MDDLSQMECVPCRKGAAPMDAAEIARRMAQVPGWSLVKRDGEQRLERVFKFPDFAAALRFTNRVGAAAEAADHHPAVLTEWGRVTVTWWTHSVKGLHLNDFIMAAKTDGLIED